MKAEIRIKKMLKSVIADCIILTSGKQSKNMNFLAVYKNSLVPNCHGEIDDERLIIFGCGCLADEYEKSFKLIFPSLVIITIK